MRNRRRYDELYELELSRLGGGGGTLTVPPGDKKLQQSRFEGSTVDGI